MSPQKNPNPKQICCSVLAWQREIGFVHRMQTRDEISFVPFELNYSASLDRAYVVSRHPHLPRGLAVKMLERNRRKLEQKLGCPVLIKPWLDGVAILIDLKNANAWQDRSLEQSVKEN